MRVDGLSRRPALGTALGSDGQSPRPRSAAGGAPSDPDAFCHGSTPAWSRPAARSTTAAALAAVRLAAKAKAMRRARIIATLGPASADKIPAMIRAGVNIFRLNFSHGSQQEHREHVSAIRAAAASMGAPVAILADIQGPKFRVGALPPEGIELADGQAVHFTRQTDSAGDSPDVTVIPAKTPGVLESMRPGQRVLLDDGKLELLVMSREDTRGRVECRVRRGGLLRSNKGINLPGAPLVGPFLSAKDRSDIALACDAGVDYLGLSFIRDAEDVRAVQAVVRSRAQASPGASQPKLVAKIEKREALRGDNLDQIMNLVAGVMVARGDLGLELDEIATLPVVQREIIAAAKRHGLELVIVATQMLESMMTSTIPSRCELSDIAGAIESGANATMLSGETAVGQYPEACVSMMARVIANTEHAMARRPLPLGTCPPPPPPPARAL